jgi:hypothetical protein
MLQSFGFGIQTEFFHHLCQKTIRNKSSILLHKSSSTVNLTHLEEEGTKFSETLLHTYQTTQCHVCENLKAYLNRNSFCVSGHSPSSCFYLKQNTTFRRLDSVSVFRWNLLSWVQSIELVPISGPVPEPLCVVLNKNRTMHNVQKHNNFINIPSSQTCRSWL